MGFGRGYEVLILSPLNLYKEHLFFERGWSKNSLRNKTFLFFYKTISNFFIIYITSINYSNKNSTAQPFTKHTRFLCFLFWLFVWELLF
jgi:hypothetical protein